MSTQSERIRRLRAQVLEQEELLKDVWRWTTERLDGNRCDAIDIEGLRITLRRLDPDWAIVSQLEMEH